MKDRIKYRRQIKECCIFAMLGSIMFCSKIVMELLPNIHLLGALTMTYTIVYRARALIPIYIYVFLNGLYAGFNFWWVPYLYIWTVLWAITMLLPREMPDGVRAVIYPIICALHGIAFGVLYAPAYAMMFGLDFEGMLAWIVTGVPFDIIHMIGNLVAGLLILPLSKLLQRLSRSAGI